MIDTLSILLILGALVAGLLLGWLFARLRAGQTIAALETQIRMAQEQAAQRQQETERHFTALAHQALRSNSEAFLQLANESLQRFQAQAVGTLAQKEQAVENLVKPIRETLEKTAQQMRRIEQERREAQGALTKHLETLAQTQQQLQGETRNLVQALRRPEVRGRWGEMTLKRLVELAGMVEYCDFFQQEQVRTEESRLRPDMIVRMPDGREIVVDVKTPLDAYLNATECGDDAMRTQHLASHARIVRERVRELSAKQYWNQFESLDFIVLFIPGDQFLSAALDVDRDLLEDALQQKVILATPTSLVALLRAVAYGWRQQALAANADKIRTLGEELYERLATFGEHLSRLGKSLGQSIDHFNKAVGSFDTKLLPGARKFTEMGVAARKGLDTPEPIDTAPRRSEHSRGED